MPLRIGLDYEGELGEGIGYVRRIFVQGKLCMKVGIGI